MITGFFLQVFYVLITAIFSLFPSWSLPPEFLSSLLVVWFDVNSFSFFVPIPTLLTVLSLSLVFWAGILILDIVLWILHLIRGR